MPWIDPLPPCPHPARPTPTDRDVGRIWQCDDCHKRWLVEILDHGHDVKPGEPTYSLFWREVA